MVEILVVMATFKEWMSVRDVDVVVARWRSTVVKYSGCESCNTNRGQG